MNYISYNKWAFPESFYPPVKNTEEYIDRIVCGADIASNSTVLITGLARNIEENVASLLHRIRNIGTMFSKYDVFIFENDSSDDTKYLLQQNLYNIKNYYLSLNDFNKKRHDNDTNFDRTVDMAFYRNHYLDFLRNNSTEYDYVIVLDTDILGGYSYEGILHSLSYNFDITTSNGLIYQNEQKLYYDTWAYRRLDHPEPHISGEINMLNYSRGEEPIKVLSAFGGTAIYKSEVLLGDEKYLSGDCDHVTLHKQLNRDVWINPSQIVLYNRSYYV